MNNGNQGLTTPQRSARTDAGQASTPRQAQPQASITGDTSLASSRNKNEVGHHSAATTPRAGKDNNRAEDERRSLHRGINTELGEKTNVDSPRSKASSTASKPPSTTPKPKDFVRRVTHDPVPYELYKHLQEKFNELHRENRRLLNAYQKEVQQSASYKKDSDKATLKVHELKAKLVKEVKRSAVYREYGDKAMLKAQEIKLKMANTRADNANWSTFCDKLVSLAAKTKSQKFYDVDEPAAADAPPVEVSDRETIAEETTSVTRSPKPLSAFPSSPPLGNTVVLPPKLSDDGNGPMVEPVDATVRSLDVDTRSDLCRFLNDMSNAVTGLQNSRSNVHTYQDDQQIQPNNLNQSSTVEQPRREQEPQEPPQPMQYNKDQPEKQASSQTTECEPDMQRDGDVHTPVHFVDQDDEIPEVISFRTLKRKRTPEKPQAGHPRRQTQRGIDSGSARIKHEDRHSSPLRFAVIAGLHDENLDLDEIPGYIETPRKRQLRRMLSNASRSEHVRHDRARSEPVDLDLMPHHLSESFEMEIEQHSGENAENRQSFAELNHEPDAVEAGSSDLPPRTESGRSGLTRKATMRSHALTPLSANSRFLPQTSNRNAQSKRRRRPYPALGELSEDGDTYRTSSTEKNTDHNLANAPTGPPKPAGGRIRNLLENATPGKEALDATRLSFMRTPGITPIARHAALDTTPVAHSAAPAPEPRQAQSTAPQKPLKSPLKRPTTTTPLAALRTSRFIDDNPSTRPEDEPLRARPLSRLCLDDFKVNAQANQGYDFAFTEVVRNLDQRKCLPGCTRLGCCGDSFRRMVEVGGALPTPSRGLWDVSDDNPEEDGDQRLLEEYLGDNARARLRQMSEAERKELLIQTKAAQLAQKHGRHRHAFQRSTTPPGFWRTDFPTTQETEEDREKAGVLERSKVEERYREAMRPGGMWVFRDE